MGKAKQLKKLRRAAEQLPVSAKRTNHYKAMKKEYFAGGVQAASDYYKAVVEASKKKVVKPIAL